jgi:hypothetical protein
MDREQIKFLMNPRMGECKDCGRVFSGDGGGNGRCKPCDKYGSRYDYDDGHLPTMDERYAAENPRR